MASLMSDSLQLTELISKQNANQKFITICRSYSLYFSVCPLPLDCIDLTLIPRILGDHRNIMDHDVVEIIISHSNSFRRTFLRGPVF